VNVYYDAIRTARYKYVHWFRDVDGEPADEEELYDLQADPFELESLHASARHAGVKAALARDLASFKDCRGDDCRRSFADPPAPCQARGYARMKLRVPRGAGRILRVRARATAGRIRLVTRRRVVLDLRNVKRSVRLRVSARTSTGRLLKQSRTYPRPCAGSR
jgi:hypothetical protein